MNNPLRVLLLTLSLLLTAAAGAQTCIAEVEPNDSPPEANPMTDASCVHGTLGSVDQDAFAWTVSEEGQRTPWRMELSSVRGQLTRLEVMRVDFTEDGLGVTGYETLLEVTTPDGRIVTSEPHLFAPGTYILGLSVSGGEGPYTLAFLPQDTGPRFHEGSEVIGTQAGFDHAGPLSQRQDFDWVIPDDYAGHLWHVELTASVGEEATLLIRDQNDDELSSITAAAGSVSLSNLGLETGTYRLELSSASGNPAPYRLWTASLGVATTGQEIEPNGSAAQSNSLVIGEEMRGTLTSGDSDYYRFTVSEEQSGRLLDLSTGTEQFLEVCLMDGSNATLQCRRGNGMGLRDLRLAAGNYGVYLGRPGEDADPAYTLLISDAGEPHPLQTTEPNDSAEQAFPLPESMGVRGYLHGEETDFVSVEITGEPQLWRMQANGAGVWEMIHYTQPGRSTMRDRGSGTLRLDNLHLLPGTHWFSIRGTDTEYSLRLLPLGAPEVEPPSEDMPVSDQNDAAPAADLAEPEPNVAAPPAGLPEHEPNNNATSADLLGFDGPRTGMLPSQEDTDYYRFHLAAPQHVRLTVTPPAGSIRSYLYWGSNEAGRAWAGADELMTGQEWLPAGEYLLALYTDNPGEGWYQVTLERLDPFTVPPGREREFPEWFGEEAVDYVPELLDTRLELRPVADSLAAFWPYGQQLELELALSNPGQEPLDLTLDWHATDWRWQLELPGTITLAAGEETKLTVPVTIAPDAPDEPVILSVRVQAPDGRMSSTAVSLTPHSDAAPAGSHVWYPLPHELLGGLNAAWLGLGAEIVFASPEEETLSARFDLPYLFDGMAPLGHGFYAHGMGDWVARDTGLAEFLPTVRLAGTGPVELQGFLLNPTGGAAPQSSLRDFAVSVSVDGQEFSEVYRGSLSARQAEQVFLLPEPVQARYVRLHLLNNQYPDSTPDDLPYMVLGTFKAIATRASAGIVTGGAGLNIADPAIGGQLVWSDPGWLAHSANLLQSGDGLLEVRTADDVEQATWVVGFHHQRAAQVTGFERLEHPDATNPLQTVELSVAVESPAGPWTPVGSWALEEPSFELTTPVWARYVRFTATGLTPRDRYHLPDQVRVIERVPDADYASVAGEWGHYGRPGPYELLHGEADWTAPATEGNISRETAAAIAAGEHLRGSVQIGVNEAWYSITVPAGDNLLSITLEGHPHRGFDFELTNADGEAVPTRQESTPVRLEVSADVTPGDYVLRVYEPPRSIVITWDTSGSVAASLPIIYRALERFAAGISPGIEEVNLLPFDNPFLLRHWSGDPLRVLEALHADPRTSSSSAGEAALLQATQGLAARPGKKAIIFLTDGAINQESGLWQVLQEVRPHIFASSISSAGALGPNWSWEQDLMQSFASLNGGHYEYVHSQADFDVSFRRAAAWLRRPSHFTLEVNTDVHFNASTWAVPELERAAEYDLIPEVLAGADLTGPITRAEFAAVAVRVYEVLTGQEAVPAAVNPFTDTSDPDVLKAYNTELAVGISDSEFAPDQLLNREQAATILTRVFKKVNLPGWTWATDDRFALDFDSPEPFADDERISGWARESVYFMAANGIITGTGNNQFTPRAVTPEEQAMGYANATREQALLLAVRLVDSR